MAKFTFDRNIALLHFTVLVWGFTGILGNLISISATQLVWYRVLIAFLSLLLYFLLMRKDLRVSKANLFSFIMTGGLVGLHWFLFFESIKVSTVSVALVCLSSVTLFTALLEPIFYKRKIAGLELFTGLLIILGIYLIFKFESQYVLGISLGLCAALTASLFSIINSKLVKKSGATVISLYEMLGAFIWISLFMLVFGGFDTGLRLVTSDFLYLLLLGTVCTSVAYVAAVNIMKALTPFRVALTANLEPIYGIVLAWMFFGHREVMSWGGYMGALLIMVTVFLYPLIRFRIEKRKNGVSLTTRQ